MNADKVRCWLAEPLPADARHLIARVAAVEDVVRVAVMPDAHVAKDVCVGMVIGTGGTLLPGAVGGDIGCGMLALPFEAEAELLSDPVRAAGVLRTLYGAVPAARRHRRRARGLPAALQGSLSHPSLDAAAREEGVLQLGTLGGGNHFVELQRDDEGRLWLMLHSGSRAMGQLIRSHHSARAATVATGLLGLEAVSAAGQAYLHDVAWARAYAAANRQAMAEAVADVLRPLGAAAQWDQVITCDHNHVAREVHDGVPLWVHRKGAMGLDAGAAGVLPGSMGTMSFHVEGRGCAAAMRSSAHGAGRAMSRAQARAVTSVRALHRQMEGVWFDPRLAGQLREESPRAYKDVEAVLRAQRELVRVVRRLRPVLVYKAP